MSDPPAPIIPVAEVRDYRRVNVELARLLDAGHRRVVLGGVDGQRLLVSQLAGPWAATVEVEGRVGPEFAAELDAPGLILIVRGDAADGVARGLRDGTVVVGGDAGDLAGSGLLGGLVVIRGAAGHRAGHRQAGGLLVSEGGAGRLVGDRQEGGDLWVRSGGVGPHAGHGRLGGRLMLPGGEGPPLNGDWLARLAIAESLAAAPGASPQ